MTKRLLLLIALIFSLTISYAQKAENVSWNFSSKKLQNGNIELIFSATIAPGYKLYSPNNPAGASLPLEITLDSNTTFTQVGKIIEVQKAEEHYEETFGVTEKFFRNKADFKIIIKPSSNKPFSVTGKLKGQACNEEFMCTMVRKNFSIEVQKKN
ncbi:MAG: hypothetical protein IIU11_10925 [Bacteroidales bacterium]|jgi:thiol:disulfide interchange protein DsbD|nr:hypothetical protein [Bacteroidales bacterium]MBR6277654.1 hypothetical protein [Bacteroidales bacterium]